VNPRAEDRNSGRHREQPLPDFAISKCR
jgi:hypothetical protein